MSMGPRSDGLQPAPLAKLPRLGKADVDTKSGQFAAYTTAEGALGQLKSFRPFSSQAMASSKLFGRTRWYSGLKSVYIASAACNAAFA